MDSTDLRPHLINGSLGPHESAPKRHLDRFSRFYVLVAKTQNAFKWGRQPKNCTFYWRWTPSNTWFLGPTSVSLQTASRSVQLFFAYLQQWLPVLFNGGIQPRKNRTFSSGKLDPI